MLIAPDAELRDASAFLVPAGGRFLMLLNETGIQPGSTSDIYGRFATLP